MTSDEAFAASKKIMALMKTPSVTFEVVRPMWTTKEGVTFPVDLMSDRHLDNAMMMLRRQGWRTAGDAAGFSDRMSREEKLEWASRPVSEKLTDLAAERLRRIEHRVPPISEEEAQAMQSRWAREQVPDVRDAFTGGPLRPPVTQCRRCQSCYSEASVRVLRDGECVNCGTPLRKSSGNSETPGTGRHKRHFWR